MDIQLQYIKKANATPAITKQEVCFADPDSIIIGRDAGCDLILESKEKTISRRHARIDKRGNCYTITDTSANGTYINKSTKPIGNGQIAILSDNDMIRLGDYWVRFQLKLSSNNNVSNNGQITKQITTHNTDLTSPKAKRVPKTPKTNAPKVKYDSDTSQLSTNQLTTKTVSTNHTNINNTKASLALPNKKMTGDLKPPLPLIPQNWNTPLETNENASGDITQSQLRKPINFSRQDSELIESLLKGLGLSSDSSELSNEKMLALGRCLRASITGMIKQRDNLEKIKTTLCYNEKNLLKELKYSSLADFATVDDFFKAMISGSQKTHAEFPLEVLKCQQEIMEDQTAMYTSFHKAADSFREELSPFRIEKIYQQKTTNIAEKLVPSIGKWDIYKKEWSKKCINFKRTIKGHFQETIKTLHQKRIEERQVIKKKK